MLSLSRTPRESTCLLYGDMHVYQHVLIVVRLGATQPSRTSTQFVDIVSDFLPCVVKEIILIYISHLLHVYIYIYIVGVDPLSLILCHPNLVCARRHAQQTELWLHINDIMFMLVHAFKPASLPYCSHIAKALPQKLQCQYVRETPN